MSHADSQSRRRRQRGYATILAVMLIGIAGAGLGAVAMHFGNEARRTRHAADEAQLRELLRAGGEILRERVASNAEISGAAVLPAELGTLTIEGRAMVERDVTPTKPWPVTALITATLPARSGATGEAALPRVASQRVTLESTGDGKWKITRAELARQR